MIYIIGMENKCSKNNPGDLYHWQCKRARLRSTHPRICDSWGESNQVKVCEKWEYLDVLTPSGRRKKKMQGIWFGYLGTEITA